MATQRDLQKEKSTQLMLDAALEIFSEKGFSASRLSDIAQRAGVAKGLVSSRFGSKDELYMTLINKLYDDYFSDLKDCKTFPDIIIKYVAKIKAMILNQFPSDKVMMQAVKLQDVPEGCSEKCRKFLENKKYNELFTDASSKGLLPEEEPYLLLQNFIKSTAGIIESYIYAGLQIPPNESFLQIIKYKGPFEKKNEDFQELKEYHSYSEKMNQKNETDDNGLVSSFLMKYLYTFRVNFRTKTFTTYNIENTISMEPGEYISYDNKIDYIANNFIYELDKVSFIEKTKIEYLIEKLSNNTSFSVSFRVLKNGVPEYCVLRYFVIKSDSNGPFEALIGFAYCEDEIYRHLAVEKLTDNFTSILYVDLDSNIFRSVKKSENFKKIDEPGKHNYTNIIEKYIERVHEDYKGVWEKLSDVNYLKEFLKNENRREYVYKIVEHYEIDNSKQWRRCIFQVIERKKNIPVTIVLAFTIIDEETANQYQMNKMIHEQKNALESQAILLEQALKQAESANIAKTQFLANISHDIRTPMNAVNGFTNLALENIDSKEKVLEYLTKASVSSNNLLNLINDVLDMSQIESGKMEIHEEICSFKELIENIITIVKLQAEQKKQIFEVDTHSVYNLDVICDKVRLNQILINLINNAVKFTPENGKIIFKIHQLSKVKDSATFEFIVKDNGIGMSQDFIEKAFQPFERERNSTISRISGAGLGLSITKNLINMMGGTVKVISNSGQGTEFQVYLTLKVIEKSVNEKKSVEKEAFDLSSKKILLVDDNDFNLEIALEMLESMGVITETAKDGAAAIQKVKEYIPKKYDAILMDIQMPVMDGYEATREIRRIEGLSIDKLPIIAMTANAFDSDRQKAFEAGMNAHLSKPIGVKDLYKVLKENIERPCIPRYKKSQ